MAPTNANGQPTVTATDIARISVFGEPGLVTTFGPPLGAPAP